MQIFQASDDCFCNTSLWCIHIRCRLSWKHVAPTHLYPAEDMAIASFFHVKLKTDLTSLSPIQLSSSACCVRWFTSILGLIALSTLETLSYSQFLQICFIHMIRAAAHSKKGYEVSQHFDCDHSDRENLYYFLFCRVFFLYYFLFSQVFWMHNFSLYQSCFQD